MRRIVIRPTIGIYGNEVKAKVEDEVRVEDEDEDGA